jgi:dihydroorotate dehydrogenase electron transfer subunit
MRTAKLLNVKTASPTAKIFTFKDEECANAKPGQFLMLWIPCVDEIPLSILDANKKGTVAVAVKNVGEATLALHGKKVGDTIGVRGPFGNNFTIKGKRLLMVGGGTGIAPLLFLAKRTLQEGLKVTFIMGAKTKDELLFRREFEKLGKKSLCLFTSTEDGTCGITGLCTEPLEEMLSKEKFSTIYACGPEKMIFRVYELAQREGTPLQASLERIMRCGIGLCGSCVVGRYRVCADGPVFTSKQLNRMKHEFGFSKRDRYGKKIPLQ